MNEQELEALTVRLVGDTAQYQQSLKGAEQATKDAAHQVEDASKKIEGFGATMKGWAMAAAGALASLGAAAFLKEAFGNFAEAESIGLRLSAVLEANSRDVEALTADYEDYAAEVQKTLGVEDDAVMALLAKAEAYDLTGQSAKDAIKNAIALAAVNGGEAESYLRLTAAIAKGDTELAMSMARMVPQLRGITDETEFMEKATRQFAVGLKTAEAEMGSAAGQLKMLGIEYGNLLEGVGKFVAVGIQPVVKWLRELVDWMQSWDDSTKAIVTVVAAATAALTPFLGALALATAAIKTLIPLVLAAKAAILGLGASVAIATGSIVTFVAAAAAIYLITRAMRDAEGAAKDLAKAAEGVEKVGGADGPSKKAIKAVEELTAALEFQVNTWGMTEAQIAIYKAQLAGATEAQLVHARALQRIVEWQAKQKQKQDEAAEAAKRLSEGVKDLTTSLEAEIATWGMSADEARIYKLALEGATAAQLANARGLAQMKKQLEEAKSLMEAGAAVTKEFATPFDKFSDRVAELNKLMDAGAISEETFGRAMKDAEKKLDEASKAAKGAREEVQRFDAALSGSAEAASRVQAFQDMLRGAKGGDGARAQGLAPRTIPDAPFDRQPVQKPMPAGAAANTDKWIEYLKQLVELAKEAAKKATLEVEAAGL